ncbi:MAG: 2-oxoacid:ferredoxin oxidoreductase subunit beta [Candidatus Omnitrophica bacterium]|nr:2-oxoacid:ferredoxin oxidoreductase subunit beta [Candidatus Omnitrophota bacterium]
MNGDNKGVLPYTKENFESGREVRWCPGCGNYSILATVQRTLAKFHRPRHQYVFVSGIGCSSRFPYYMNTYGFHTIHGRAPAVATGLRCVNPALSIWVVSGDGDGLSIGGNHLLHCLRRNLNINILLVNNQIYGLTKGQYSPTSRYGKVSQSSPEGSIEHPVNALCVAIASEATFIARTLDSDPRHMSIILERAEEHKGVSFVEIYQNCLIFNDKTFAPITGRDTREERMIYLEDGKPLIFGKRRQKGIRLRGLKPERVEWKQEEGKAANPPKDLVIHHEKDPDPTWAYLLTQMVYPEMPTPFGIFRALEKPTYDGGMESQIGRAIKRDGRGDLKALIAGTQPWRVK